MSKKRSNLPKCMYYKHGAYYLVKKNKWIPLGKSYAGAMAEYGRLSQNHPKDSVGQLVKDTIDEASTRLAANTIKQYRGCEKKISSAFIEFQPDQVKPKHIAQFMAHHSKTPNMANRMLSLLRMSFDRGVLYGLCEINPAISIPRLKEGKRDRLISDDEYQKIWRAANPDVRAIMDLCYATAQRIGDVLKIRMSDISRDGLIVKQQKTGNTVPIKMSPALRDAIKQAKALHPRKVIPVYLVGMRNGKKRSYYGTRDAFNRAKKAAGVLDVTLHDIRAKALTDAKGLGIDATALAGHSNEAQTERYLRDKTIQFVDTVDSLPRKILDI